MSVSLLRHLLKLARRFIFTFDFSFFSSSSSFSVTFPVFFEPLELEPLIIAIARRLAS